MQRFDGQRILITGASRGLGLALMEELAQRGATVVGVARSRGPLEAACERLRAAGLDVHAVAADVGRPEAAIEIAARAAAQGGPPDLLIHNASTLGPVPLKLLLDTSREALEAVLAVNVVGPFTLTRAVVGGMVVRGRGCVLAISSDAAVEAYPSWGPYGASKAAQDHLQRVWAAELEGSGVRFLSVDPGEMNTQMHADAVPDADPDSLAEPREVARRIVEVLGQDQPSGTRCSLQEVRV